MSASMDLPAEDHDFLRSTDYTYEVFEEGNMLCVLLSNVTLPPGLNREQADILLRLAPLYPDAPPDMWWVSPSLTTASGGEIPATQTQETHRNQVWQRWSRHLPAGSWSVGIDNLESYLAVIRADMCAAAGAFL
ncbi:MULTISPECIES: E2/UBC family protein [Streptacidiphilus]|uniref:E2/UBC family protein n=1 Tax=Streptacidiphilus cavernicola TaxID=3342716 RepID=A0ABV6UU37_9ACTN|nr:E2/UBC family protein [Streptacidiphilus jeojiense]